MLHPYRFRSAVLCLSGALTALPALAQTRSELNEIIVTATKIDKSAQELGLSLTVLDGEPLGQFDGAEALAQRVSGLQAAIANGNHVAFQIRGIGAVDHQALTPTAAAVYIDQTYLATNVQTGPLLFDLQRAEILKGPQGALYGRNASSGAINLTSVQPGPKKTGYIASELGSFDRVNVAAAATFPVSDIFSLRLSGRSLTQNPTLENVVTNPAVEAPKLGGGARDEFGVRLLGLLQTAPSTEVLLNLHYAEDNGVNPAPLNSSLALNAHQISIGPDGIQDTDNAFYGGAVTLSHEGGPFTLTSHSAYEAYNQNYGFDFDGTPAPFNVTSLNANLAYDRDFVQVSEELRLNFRSERAELMGGIYLEAQDFDQDYLIWCGDRAPDAILGSCRYVGAPGRTGPNPASLGVATSLLSEISQSRKTAALFSYNTFRLSPKLDLVAGARLSFETIKGEGEGRHYFDTGVVALNNRDDLGLAIGQNKIEDTRLSGNLGLNYKISDQTLVYASYSNGFKTGGFNGEVINNAAHFSNAGLFDAETVNAFETGLKLTRDRVRLNLATFYQFYDKPQARIFVPFATDNGGSFTSNSLSNLDEAVSYGVEGDITLSPIKGLDLFAGMTALETKINQTESLSVPQNAEIFDGNPLPFASKFSATISARYERALSETLSASLQANGKYQSAFFLDAEGRDDRAQPAYEIIDAHATLHFKSGIELGLWGRNLSQSDYAVSGFGFIGYNTFRGEPRRYGVSLKYSY